MHNIQREIHTRFTEALIEVVEENMSQEGLYLEILRYFESASTGIRIGLAFCPSNEELLRIFKGELS